MMIRFVSFRFAKRSVLVPIARCWREFDPEVCCILRRRRLLRRLRRSSSSSSNGAVAAVAAALLPFHYEIHQTKGGFRKRPRCRQDTGVPSTVAFGSSSSRRRCAEAMELTNTVQQQPMKSPGGRVGVEQELGDDGSFLGAGGLRRRFRFRWRRRRRPPVVGARFRAAAAAPRGSRRHGGRAQQQFPPFLRRALVGAPAVVDGRQIVFQRADDPGRRAGIRARLGHDPPEAGLDPVESFQRGGRPPPPPPVRCHGAGHAGATDRAVEEPFPQAGIVPKSVHGPGFVPGGVEDGGVLRGLRGSP
mmetsp:Transcript_23067/g.47010  ORF Transcript_23067/g.47010 Transcript_23067/m.47010 type:complete len:303 (+) Transcript_23067:210-1118(+)